MGRSSTGAVHHFASLRLNISDIQKYTSKQDSYNRTIEWNVNGRPCGSIRYDVSFKVGNRYLRLKYTHTDYEGKKFQMDYKIQIIGVPSNLGNGENLYFVCPISNELCKILYSCYGSKYFMSRKAYPYRIYYTSQIYSKRDRINNYYFELENEIKDLKKKIAKSHYQGVKTHIQNRIERLEDKSLLFDLERMRYFANSIAKFKGLLR